MYKFLFILLLTSLPTFAQSESLQEESTLESLTSLFHGKGEHTCWSRTSVGHKCTVELRDITDCNSGYYRLKNQDCCPLTPDRGNSIDFKMLSCSSLF